MKSLLSIPFSVQPKILDNILKGRSIGALLSCPIEGKQNLNFTIKALHENWAITKLNCSKGRLSAKEMKAITEALKYNTSLRDLCLSDNDLNDESILNVSKILNNNKNLSILKLDFNNISKKGLQYLAQSMIQNESLEYLSLEGNKNMGFAGLKSVAIALTFNKTLKILNLGSNYFGDNGANAIAQLIATNKTLETLGFSTNLIGLKGVKTISEGLKYNQSLKHMDLSENQIPFEGIKKLLEISNSVHINLTYNSIASSEIEYIKNTYAHSEWFNFYAWPDTGTSLMAEDPDRYPCEMERYEL